MPNQVQEFKGYPSKLNKKMLADNHKIHKLIFKVDVNTYGDGDLAVKTKAISRLSASAALRCYDHVKYRLEHSKKAGTSKTEILKTLEITTLVGDTIVGPHVRRTNE